MGPRASREGGRVGPDDSAMAGEGEVVLVVRVGSKHRSVAKMTCDNTRF